MRWFALAVLFTCIAISSYYRRRARRESEVIERRREGGGVMMARLVGGLGGLAIILIQVLSPAWMRWASFSSPRSLQWVGAFAGLFTVPMAYWVMSSLGRNVSETVLTKQNHALVTAGPYRWIRHPLYTNGIVLLASLGLMLTSWLILLLALVAIVLFRFLVIPAEEGRLIAKLGVNYRTYMRRTGRFLPRLRAVPSAESV